MRTSAIVFLVYGLLVIAGGLMGYAKARSAPSLIAGASAGALLLIGAIVMLRRPQVVFFEIGVAALLILFFLYRLISTGKVMPAVPTILLSAIAILVAILQIRRP